MLSEVSICECCKQSFDTNTILKHIGHKKACKAFYGLRYNELKKEQNRKKVENFRDKLSLKKREEMLRTERERYHISSELKEKRKVLNLRRKEKIQDEKLKKAKNQGEKCLEDSQDFKVKKTKEGDMWQCGFCKIHFSPDSILKHIAHEKDCKSFYGPRFEELKKEHRRQRKEFSRRDKGIKKELEQQKICYASKLEVRDKKKATYETDKKNRKIYAKEQEKKQRIAR